MIVGAGKAGTSLACSLKNAGFPVSLVLRRPTTRAIPVPVLDMETLTISRTRPVVVLLAVPDRCLSEVAAQWLTRAPPDSRLVLGHLSGVLPSATAFPMDDGRLVGRFSAHPLHAFPPPDPPVPLPAGVPFLIEGDGAGAAIAEALVLSIEGTPIPIAPSSKALAHGAAVLAANLPAELVFAAADIFRDLGVPEPDRVASRLFRSLADNLDANPSPSALTGPVARGDAETVKADLSALDAWSRGATRSASFLYRRLSRRLEARMRRAGIPGDPSRWKRIREALK